MTARREKLNIYKTRAPEHPTKPGDDSSSCIWMPINLIIGYFVLSAIARVNSNRGSKLDQFICYGLLSIVVIMFIVSWLEMRFEKKAWMKICTVATVSILGRRERGTWDDGFRYHSFPCRMELEMNADQRAVFPKETVVSIEVGDLLYEKLEKRQTVRIYYLPEAPMAFLLEGEI